VLAAGGVFDDDGMFTMLPAIPSRALKRRFRSEVLDLLMAAPPSYARCPC